MLIGSVSKAVSLRDREEEYLQINKLFNDIENVDKIDLIQKKDELFKDKQEIDNILSYINLVFFDKIKIDSKYIKCMKIVEDTKDRLRKNNNYDMTIDNFIMTVWEEINGEYYRSEI